MRKQGQPIVYLIGYKRLTEKILSVGIGQAQLCRQKIDFGHVTGYGKMSGEHFTMAEGADIAPLLQGLEDDLCQSPHRVYLIEGALTVSYKDGSEEQVSSGDLFYWPPGHTVRVEQDAEFVLYSPQKEHTPVMEHINRKLSQ